MAKVAVLSAPHVVPQDDEKTTTSYRFDADSPFDGSYMLVPVDTLPAINVDRTLRILLLGKTWSNRHVAFMRRHRAILSTLYYLGLLYRFYGMVVPARLSGHWWLLLTVLIQFPTITSVSLSLRYEFVVQLSKSFEFWFFSVVNVVWAVSFFIGYSDSRSCIAFFSWIELEHGKMLEATVNRANHAVATAVLAAVSLSVCFVGVSLGLIDVVDIVVWRSPRGHALTIANVLGNSMATIVLLMVRLTYRNRHALRHTDREVVQCTTCRCRLQFVNCHEQQQQQAATKRPRRPPLIGTQIIQLQYVAIEDKFDASCVVFGSVDKWQSLWLLQWAWKLVLILALLAMVMLTSTPPTSVIYQPPMCLRVALSVLVLNTAAVGPFLALHQRLLLSRLFGSFDFVFLFFQLTLLGGCVCHLHHWAPHHCVIALCTWMWFYVVATHDALTPAAKHALGWTPARAMALASLLLAIHVMLGVELAVGVRMAITDRVLLDFMVLGHRVQLYIIPFLFGRLVTLLIWNGRIVWRLAVCSLRPGGDRELITLQGAVQYHRAKRNSMGSFR